MSPAGLRVGIAIPQSFGEPASSVAAIRAFMARAEAVGFDSLWVQEQLLGRDRSFEPLTMLAYAAACTTRIRLCSAAFIAPVRNPIVFAKALATLDQLSVGRLTVGISLGDMRGLFPASGIPIESRAARLEELVELLRRFWTEERFSHHGRFFSVDDASMEPKPVQKPSPPIWFGGHSEVALERAVRLGDGWIGAGGRSISQFGESAALVRDLAASTGKPQFPIAKKLYLAIGRSRDEAFGRLRTWFDAHWGGIADGGELAGRVGVFGTPEQVVERIVETWQLGASLVILNPVYDEAAHLETIAAEVLPALRERTAEPREPRPLVARGNG